MKKFLLIAAAVLVTSTASAQLLERKSQATKGVPAKSEVKQIQKVQMQKPVIPMQMTTVAPMQTRLGNPVILTSRELKSIKPIRRRVEIQDKYDCYGIDDSNENVSWNMLKAENEDGDMFFANVIPTPYPDVEEMQYIYAEINQDGNTINIGAQEVFSYQAVDENGNETGDTYHVFLTGELNTTNHSIDLTMNEDGTLSTAIGEEINYLVFDSDKIDVGEDIYKRVADGGHYLGYLEYVGHIQYLLPGMSPKPNALYAPEGVNLNITMTPEGLWYGHQFSIMPANVPAVFTNVTTDMADAYEWSVTDDGNDETITGIERDFTFVPECYNEYTIPTLVAKFKDAVSDPVQWNEDGYILGSGGASTYLQDPDDIMVTNCNLDYGLSLYGYMGTPDINTQKYSISNLIIYQGKPAAPLYFEGISFYVYKFEQKEDFELNCKIMKCTRDEHGKLVLGDLIAVAGIDTESMIITEDGDVLLTWTQFEEEDENGFTSPVDYVQVDDEFCVVFEGWDNGTFTAVPVGERTNNTAQLTSSYLTLTGADDDVVGFQNLMNRMWVNYMEGMYGSLYTADNTTLEIPAEGGSATIHVEPMFCGNDEDGNRVTALWFAEDYELPEWLDVAIDNEVYKSSSEDEDGEFSFDLIVKAEALPEGVTCRTETIDFYQWGAKLTLVVNQGDVDGITVTTATVRTADGKTYNLAGQRVLKNINGVVIRNGRKFIRK
ncbi:MAG: hypothetical protein J5797_10060 [Prevotella sp.]|nr:hypothetical protein [Prevotella sp.]